MPEAEPKGHVASEECRLGEGQRRARIVSSGFDTEGQRLATAKKVPLRKIDCKRKSGVIVVGAAERQQSGGLLLHIDVHDDLVGSGPGAGVHRRGPEKPERPDSFGSVANLARIEWIALHRRELAADDPVQRGLVAADVDALHEYSGPAHKRKLDVERKIAFVSGDDGVDAQEIEPLLQGKSLQTRDLLVNQGRRPGVSGTDAQSAFVFGKIGIVKLARKRNLANRVLLAFANCERHESRVALARQFHGRVENLDVDITARAIEIDEELAVKGNPLRNV